LLLLFFISPIPYIFPAFQVFFGTKASILIPEADMMGKSGVLALILLILFPCKGSAFPDGNAATNCIPTHINEETVQTLYGEIVEINPGIIRLHTSEREYVLSFTRNARFYCNDSPSLWQALRPVYSNAFFEAFVKISCNGDLIEAKGYYIGKECLIERWENENDTLKLYLKTVEEEREMICPLAPDARVPGAGWLSTEEPVFVLFSIRGEVRAVYPI
jgi:hypothetical protein